MRLDPRLYTTVDGAVDLNKYRFFVEQEEMRQVEAAGGLPVKVQVYYRLARVMQKNAPMEHKPYPDKPGDWFPPIDAWVEEILNENAHRPGL